MKKKEFRYGLVFIIASDILAYTAVYLDRDLPQGEFSDPSVMLTGGGLVLSFIGSYLVLRAKNRSWRWVAFAVFGIVGHLVIFFILEDKEKTERLLRKGVRHEERVRVRIC